MSKNCTADDFSRTNTATRGAGELARRMDPEGWLQWKYVASDGSEGWRADESMAAEGWVPVLVESRITLDALAAAWEAAEQADECREGDVLIIRDDEDNYLVRHMDDRSDLDSTARILSRAPEPEPWVELADSLEAEVQWIDRFNAVDAAQALHAAGWRKAGDNDE